MNHLPDAGMNGGYVWDNLDSSPSDKPALPAYTVNGRSRRKEKKIRIVHALLSWKVYERTAV